MTPGPLTAYLHRAVLARVDAAESVLDMGGTGTAGRFTAARVTDANVRDGVDACRLPYADRSFDATISVATLEHVREPAAFLAESVRVARARAVHWFPFGPAAAACEVHKATVPGYSHPCMLPDLKVVWPYVRPECARFDPLLTIREYMLLLMHLHPQFNAPATWAFVDRWTDQPYGYVLEIQADP